MAVKKREDRIRELMKLANMTRQEAEFAVAIELGELPGDVIETDEPDDNEKPSA